ncbi:hypothetical protein IW261DRAFT_1465850 [Armillaria novae-zelandiae]|uniref:Secreted protein n=1 Tax=Armillaria novae-zelandiae TaxID=153914 RepID=A0AA39PGQ1_9AGAR|nr:hypothetical protein IW261DRAFT_1465850 [Armillaria novae-zelandiae]
MMTAESGGYSVRTSMWLLLCSATSFDITASSTTCLSIRASFDQRAQSRSCAWITLPARCPRRNSCLLETAPVLFPSKCAIPVQSFEVQTSQCK